MVCKYREMCKNEDQVKFTYLMTNGIDKPTIVEIINSGRYYEFLEARRIVKREQARLEQGKTPQQQGTVKYTPHKQKGTSYRKIELPDYPVNHPLMNKLKILQEQGKLIAIYDVPVQYQSR